MPHLEALLVERVFEESGVVCIVARTREEVAVCCPMCGTPSSRINLWYERSLADAPVGGRPVKILLSVRHLFCDDPGCVRRTFAEQVPDLTFRYGRRTVLERVAVTAIGVALAGRAGARLGAVLQTAVSRMTLLRLVMALPDPAWAVPAVLGVDDFAVRKGQHYGTVLIDCLTHQPLELLLGRDAEPLSAWLKEHPGVTVICRDRAGAYADGARTGAPQAVQIADRYHLLQNLGQAVERCVREHRACLRPPDPDPPEDSPVQTSAQWLAALSPIEVRFRERHAAVHGLLGQGHGIREIARELHLGRKTVQRCARAATPERMLGGRQQPRPSRLDPFKPYLAKRWDEGLTSAVLLLAEITELGYRGSYGTLNDHLRPLRRTRVQTALPRPPSVREVTGWMMRHPDRLDTEQTQQLKELCTHCPELGAVHSHVRAFALMLTTLTGDAEHLTTWIAAVRADDVPGLHSFATGLCKDWDAVVQGLTSERSSGAVEGRVNHIILWNQQCQAVCL
ncbi:MULTISPECIES: ISL3 family transposase [Streptomyces]|uniref:ISL3 family transposase n=2 Tax=Streptomyces TaxID=1883 RepID=A0ABV9J7G1_9ACTN